MISVNRAPRFLILPTIILIGILGSTAGDAANYLAAAGGDAFY